MIDGDVFRVIVPLDDEYSFEVDKNRAQNLKGKNCTINCTLTEKAILEYLKDNPTSTQTEIASAIGKSLRTVKNVL
ncbi:MAG: winged helix-turn-helix domain-containing protein [Oscillospiraceae bacterium]|nr:winged helix-turn-helix domain-containing protein [Oscillospiraceae bacterium]